MSGIRFEELPEYTQIDMHKIRIKLNDVFKIPVMFEELAMLRNLKVLLFDGNSPRDREGEKIGELLGTFLSTNTTVKVLEFHNMTIKLPTSANNVTTLVLTRSESTPFPEWVRNLEEIYILKSSRVTWGPGQHKVQVLDLDGITELVVLPDAPLLREVIMHAARVDINQFILALPLTLTKLSLIYVRFDGPLRPDAIAHIRSMSSIRYVHIGDIGLLQAFQTLRGFHKFTMMLPANMIVYGEPNDNFTVVSAGANILSGSPGSFRIIEPYHDYVREQAQLVDGQLAFWGAPRGTTVRALVNRNGDRALGHRILSFLLKPFYRDNAPTLRLGRR